MPRLPNGDLAVIDPRKLIDYCLDPTHPRGRHKARVFREALGIERRDAGWLREELLRAVRTCEATKLITDNHGSRWQVDAPIERQNKSCVVRSVWMFLAGEDIPRLVTCWVL